MAKVIYAQPRVTYFNVLADGKFHQSVEEGTEGAVKREWESSDGKSKGVKWELVAQSITGKIENLAIHEGEYGRNVLITFEEGGEDEDSVVVSLAVKSNFGEDFMHKLSNIDITKEVTITPYSFDDEDGKKKKGLSIKQDEVKLPSYYNKYNETTKKWEALHGCPKSTEKSSKNWELYFGTVREFLVEELEKHPLFNAKTIADSITVEANKPAYPTGEETGANNDIPF